MNRRTFVASSAGAALGMPGWLDSMPKTRVQDLYDQWELANEDVEAASELTGVARQVYFDRVNLLEDKIAAQPAVSLRDLALKVLVADSISDFSFSLQAVRLAREARAIVGQAA